MMMIRSANIPAVLNRICGSGSTGNGCSKNNNKKNQIKMAFMVTADGELLGASDDYNNNHEQQQQQESFYDHDSNDHNTIIASSSQQQIPDPESFGTLVADIAMDYYRLGMEYSLLQPYPTSNITNPSSQQQQQQQQHRGNSTNSNSSVLQFLSLEMDYGIIGIIPCSMMVVDCFIVAVASNTTEIGYLKLQCTNLVEYIQQDYTPSVSVSVPSVPTTMSSTQQQLSQQQQQSVVVSETGTTIDGNSSNNTMLLTTNNNNSNSANNLSMTHVDGNDGQNHNLIHHHHSHGNNEDDIN